MADPAKKRGKPGEVFFVTFGTCLEVYMSAKVRSRSTGIPRARRPLTPAMILWTPPVMNASNDDGNSKPGHARHTKGLLRMYVPRVPPVFGDRNCLLNIDLPCTQTLRTLRQRLSGIFGPTRPNARHQLATWSEVDLLRSQRRNGDALRDGYYSPPSVFPSPPQLPEMTILPLSSEVTFTMIHDAIPTISSSTSSIPAVVPILNPPKLHRKSFMHLESTNSCLSQSEQSYTLHSYVTAPSSPASARHTLPSKTSSIPASQKMGRGEPSYATRPLPNLPSRFSSPSPGSSAHTATPRGVQTPTPSPSCRSFSPSLPPSPSSSDPGTYAQVPRLTFTDPLTSSNISNISTESLFEIDIHQWPSPPQSPTRPRINKASSTLLLNPNPNPNLNLNPHPHPNLNPPAIAFNKYRLSHSEPSSPIRTTHERSKSVPNSCLATVEVSLGGVGLGHYLAVPGVIELPGPMKEGVPVCFTLLAPSRAVITAYCAFHARTRIVAKEEGARLKVVLESGAAMEGMRVYAVGVAGEDRNVDGEGEEYGEDAISFFVEESSVTLAELAIGVARASF
ncbi:hypothetical protein M422DRAFT_258872 [Sphaerobolus stellatus SS14]|uniref:Uncharacterized protein n=1 Tax=Sphaerobolus stellatus (strain SS14) TaxID=990650 RepID=A0A0C9U689_SPHS4|nr:hypothetical protein M422DRAFT_258872 [Sphaerobolus stellatus SS14]